MTDARIIKRRYTDRLGRPITEPATIEARYVAERLHRLANARAKAGQSAYVPVSDLARATKLTAARVVEIIREYDSWLWGLVETDGPIEEWEVFADGE